jgi:hypothetical protein
MRDLQREFNVDVSFSFTIPATTGTSVVFWVALTAKPRWVGKMTVRCDIARQRRWPHVDHQTMAGLMLFLVHDLHVVLEAQGMVPVQEALFG